MSYGCWACAAIYHSECAVALGRCGILGCGAVVPLAPVPQPSRTARIAARSCLFVAGFVALLLAGVRLDHEQVGAAAAMAVMAFLLFVLAVRPSWFRPAFRWAGRGVGWLLARRRRPAP
jgi:hypothetical protein